MNDFDERHECPAPKCQERIPYDLFACHGHWYALPASLRSKIWHAYNHRKKTGNAARHIEAYKLALEFYAEHEIV